MDFKESISVSTPDTSELDELVSDLKELKEELYTARTERHSAKMEATALKNEIKQRLSDVTQMKNLIRALAAVNLLKLEVAFLSILL